MALAPAPDRTAIRLAERLIQLLGRGARTSTYKYAVLIGLMDLCMELTGPTALPPDMITTRQLAEKVIELYWPHCAPYPDTSSVLRQNTGSGDTQAEIIQHIEKFRKGAKVNHAASLPISRARAATSPEAYEKLVRVIEWKLIEMPLPRLQIIGGVEDRFLYQYGFNDKTTKREVDLYQHGKSLSFDNRLLLASGVSAALIALNGVVRPLIYRSWADMVARVNVLDEPKLEKFLFGEERIALDSVRPGLRDLQDGRCFYCEKSLGATCHVDHFVPWARHADNSIDNLVAAHVDCNGQKSDYLAAAEHVVRWRERSARHADDLAAIAVDQQWETRPQRTLSVARAIYQMLPDDARLWLSGRSFLVIDRPRISGALAA
ncbi:MAG: HNH endonuclease domain-containing protein [Byssovorax sp.]